MNIGEGGEAALKIRLAKMRDEGLTINGEMIIDVSFDESFPRIPNVIYEEAKISNDNEIVEIAKNIGIDKAGPSEKSDVYINGTGYSVKSIHGANPALVNHTTRWGFLQACNYVGSDIEILDTIIDNYWDLRLKGIIKEDVHTNDQYSPFKEYKEYFRPILEYFLFIGSGRGISAHPAEMILEYDDPFDEKTWRFISKDEAFDSLWNNLVFSVRSKGMEGYHPEIDCDKTRCISKWTRKCDGRYKGALHIRVAEKSVCVNQRSLF